MTGKVGPELHSVAVVADAVWRSKISPNTNMREQEASLGSEGRIMMLQS